MAPPASSDTEMTTLDWVLAILCSTIGCIVGIVYLIQGKPKATKMIIVSLIAGFIIGAISSAIQYAMLARQ